MLQHKIREAFADSVSVNPKGYRYLRTKDFVCALQSRGIHFSGREANQWIENYVTTFRDVSTQEGDDRTFQLFNPNGGL
ncbi:TPA: DNA polymerase V [Klebsiella pneumoniae]|nr:DNA polymerase V [Klebsiella pneumoniae]